MDELNFSKSMLFNFNIYSSLLLTFFIHFLIYACMLLWRGIKQENLSDLLLGSFIFLSALYIVPWMTGFAGWYDDTTYVYRDILFYTPMIHGLLLGPLLFLYVLSITNFSFKMQKQHYLHFIPGLLYLIWSFIVFVVDKIILKKYFLMNGETDPDFSGWYQFLQQISIVIYLTYSIKHYRKYRNYTNQELSFAESAAFKWLKNFLIAFGVLTILPLVQEFLWLLVPYFKNLDYVGSWYYFISFAIVVYYISINGFHNSNIPIHKLHFNPEEYTKEAFPITYVENEGHSALQNRDIDDLTIWKERIHAVIVSERLFEDSTLTLSRLSSHLHSNNNTISKVINSGFGKNFSDFINEYRVNALLEHLKNNEYREKTFLGLAFECGFNSKATFNRAFKKQIGMSPKEWLIQQQLS
ncbi:MAG: helix-turn-helix domain-containing protein [Hydrotalea sp.]|nr:helix-turn-helix domain-containing protein [Hydrotalea sp.]